MNKSSSADREKTPPASETPVDEVSASFRSEDINQKLQSLKQGIDDPPKRSHQIVSALGIVLILILIMGALTGGFKRLVNLFSDSGKEKAERIQLDSEDGRRFVLLVKRGENSEVRLLDAATGEMQDVSLGDTHARQASLSYDGQTVAYISTSDSGSSLYLASKVLGTVEVFSDKSLNKTAKAISGEEVISVCEWSGLYWSPQNNKLAFFGCASNASVLFIVDAAEQRLPQALVETKINSNEPREARWLKNGGLVYTSGEPFIDSVFMIDSTYQKLPRLLYGPRK